MAKRLPPGQRAAILHAIARRGELDLSQRELAEKAGVSERTIQSMEAFATWPRTSTRAQIERSGLGWHVGYLNEYAERHNRSDTSDQLDRDIQDILESDLNAELKLRLIDRLREIRTGGATRPERRSGVERDAR